MASTSLLSQSALVAKKDLRVEVRSRVGISQVAPFAILVLVIFAFALDGNRQTLQQLTAGLYWVAVLFSAVMLVQRTFAIESDAGIAEATRLSSLQPSAVFVGKAAALIIQMLAVEVLLGAGVFVFFSAELSGWGLLLATVVVATVGVACAGTLYGVLTAGLRVKETLLPILLLPVLAPVLIGATRATGAALGDVAVDGWAWFSFLGLFALIYVALGIIAFGTLMEEE